MAISYLGLAACSPQPAAQQGTVSELDGAFEFTTLEIVNDAGELLTFDVYLAQDFDRTSALRSRTQCRQRSPHGHW